MTTFYDPATIRRLAETGDAFYRGAAWILDQQDAARLARAVDDVADRSEFRPVDEVRARLHARRLDRNADTTDYDSEWRRTPNAADLGAPRIG